MLPVLLFLRVGIWNSYGTRRTTKHLFDNGGCLRPISSSMQLRTYWNFLQKGVWHLVVFIKKMGSPKIAVKVFLDAAAVSDDMMLDCWIPDEDSPSNSWPPFAVGIISTYQNELQKGGQLLGCILQKNGLQARARWESVVTNCQKCFNGFLPRAHFLDNHEAVMNFLLQEILVGYKETKCKRKFRDWGWKQLPLLIYNFCCSYSRPVVPCPVGIWNSYAFSKELVEFFKTKISPKGHFIINIKIV
jgi:hypothetical protein